MLNTGDHRQSAAIANAFSAEHELLGDTRRLPAHPSLMTVLRAFTDDASALPGWDFEADLVQPRTLMLAMPFVPKDLKNILRASRRPVRAARRPHSPWCACVISAPCRRRPTRREARRSGRVVRHGSARSLRGHWRCTGGA
eukprot:SAG11_NODE_7103_length_1193_cov_1.266910_1_plen_140_part_10